MCNAISFLALAFLSYALWWGEDSGAPGSRLGRKGRGLGSAQAGSRGRSPTAVPRPLRAGRTWEAGSRAWKPPPGPEAASAEGPVWEPPGWEVGRLRWRPFREWRLRYLLEGRPKEACSGGAVGAQSSRMYDVNRSRHVRRVGRCRRRAQKPPRRGLRSCVCRWSQGGWMPIWQMMGAFGY
ncbi:uncharacterized protein LOC144331106 [Macaca mulatta]